MMDDRELTLIAAFRLHEVAGRLNVLARVARSPQLRETLLELSRELADHERLLSELGSTLPASASAVPQPAASQGI